MEFQLILPSQGPGYRAIGLFIKTAALSRDNNPFPF